MSVPVFLHKLEFVFNKNQSDGCRSQQYEKKGKNWQNYILGIEKYMLMKKRYCYEFYKKQKVFANLFKWTMCPFNISYGISKAFSASQQ